MCTLSHSNGTGYSILNLYLIICMSRTCSISFTQALNQLTLVAFPVVFDVDYSRMIELIDGLDELQSLANVPARFKPD